MACKLCDPVISFASTVGICISTVFSKMFFLFKEILGKSTGKNTTSSFNCIQEMAEGNLDVKEEEDLGIFEPFKNQLFKVQDFCL